LESASAQPIGRGTTDRARTDNDNLGRRSHSFAWDLATTVGRLRFNARHVIAHRWGVARSLASTFAEGALCGEERTNSGSSYASSATRRRSSAYSSISRRANDSVGSRVMGSGTTHGWWLVK